MKLGKIGIQDLERMMKRHGAVMLKSNRIGSDFSFMNLKGISMVFKMEPMVYYPFLSSQENAKLSLAFPMNDFLTSGTFPQVAMIDMEKPMDVGKEYWDYVDSLFTLFEGKGIKIASGHTGNYENIRSGVVGSIALIGYRKPVFSYLRIRERDAFYLIGSIGLETRYFYEKRKYGKSTISEETLSVEKYVLPLLRVKGVHYIHDLSEGGLIRGLREVSLLTGKGFRVQYSGVKHLLSGLRYGSRVERVSSSSSGSILVSVGFRERKSFEDFVTKKGWPFTEIPAGGRGVTLDGKVAVEYDIFPDVMGLDSNK